MKFADRLRKLLGFEYIDESIWDDLFDLLVEGDMGPVFSESLVSELKKAYKENNIKRADQALAMLGSLLKQNLTQASFELSPDALSVVMLLGVNGVGKTTTTAKLANYFQKKKGFNNIIMAAGDTFRAAAIDQLKKHGQNLSIKVIAQAHGSDAGAVIFDAIESAQASSSSLVLADTAGRMHTKQNLVLELKKLDKIVLSKISGDNFRKLLVLDATTGTNALRQAEIFSQAVKIDGIVLTKYDSSARGGIISTINKELGIPTVFLGTGESYDDLRSFKIDEYLESFLGNARK